MTSNLADLFKNYGITGNPTLDTLILTSIIPFLITYATTIFTILQKFVSTICFNKLYDLYNKLKKKFLGTIEFRLCVSQEKSIYPTIKSIFFSPVVISDNIDAKTLSVLNLITESKYGNDATYYNYDVHDLYMDSFNNIAFEKRMDFGSSISKKYFKFENYYIVVSENKKTDYKNYYRGDYDDDDKPKAAKPEENKNDKKEYFILFEAIRYSDSAITTSENIIKKFLYERMKINTRIPYKYTIKITNMAIANKFDDCDSYKNDNNSVGQLCISDDINDFFANPSVRIFYGNDVGKNKMRSKNKMGVSSSITADFKSNTLNIENMTNELLLSDDNVDVTSSNLFEPNFKSILTYFFGTRFSISKISSYYFYLRHNKIILYFHHVDPTCTFREKYLCVVSFQEILNREKIIDIFTTLIKSQLNTKKNDPNDKKIRIYNYTNGEWNSIKCDSRSYDTIFLPLKTKQLVTSEMDKFICFEKVFQANGIPYKKGFLFYGPPGTGKTSLVRALAHAYNIPIYIFDVNNGSVNDENICSIINSISGIGNRILLFEDIDSAFADKEELKYQTRNDINKIDNTKNDTDKKSDNKIDKNDTGKKFLSFSGLINCLDGITAGLNGIILIMTTNYPEKLGAALTRPGRIDFCLELTYCDRFQIIEMTKNMIARSYNIIETVLKNDIKKSTSQTMITFNNPYSEEHLMVLIEKFADNLIQGKQLSTIKPCELQVHILKHIGNVTDIFDKYEELLNKN